MEYSMRNTLQAESIKGDAFSESLLSHTVKERKLRRNTVFPQRKTTTHINGVENEMLTADIRYKTSYMLYERRLLI